MRDRLIELINNAYYESLKYEMANKFYPFDDYISRSEFVADYLLENGVIVPPCKVGDTTYIFDYKVNNHLKTTLRGIVPSVVEAITIEDEGLWIENEHAKYHITSVGELIFLTREEAERALKGGVEK